MAGLPPWLAAKQGNSNGPAAQMGGPSGGPDGPPLGKGKKKGNSGRQGAIARRMAAMSKR